ncbi:septation protein A [Thiomonas bhubaneswarensis]|uniref:Inner membrane-spanning protein YciB n=1 Tax=Thiomonas bhubaneswarensis TaxID=339866 RepID=A0A0K6I739_9BURK|nr:septation protein A [Thiomonas bhubaneswarensis]CUA98954.1 intracellular septation protein A [Thiomonas bhubaneswarensis]
MKILFDFFPIILFFIVFKVAGIYAATAVTIAATFAQIGWVWFKHRKVEPMLWLSLGVVVIFGGATLLFHNDTFIKWKPTVLYWLFAVILAGAQLLQGKNLMRSLMGKQMQLPDPIWNRVNWSWVAFFALMGVLNIVIAYNFSTNLWVDFKLFGSLGLTLVFVLGQSLLLAKHMKLDENA